MRVVVVIADDLGVRESLAAALRESSVVFIEPTADAALRRMLTVPADAVVIDDTPKLGIKALTHLRAAAPNVPVIALLGRADSETHAGFIVAGAHACVPKPFSCEDLLAAVENATRSIAQATSTALLPAAAVVDVSPVDRHHTALRWLSRATANLDNPRRMAELLVEAMGDVFGTARCAVLLEDGGTVRVAASQGLPQALVESLRLDFSTGLMRSLELSPVLLDRAYCSDTASIKQMQLLGARLAVPLLCGGAVNGALLVGDSPSGRDYSSADRELLALLARTAGTALENAHRYLRVSGEQGILHTIFSRLASGVVLVAPDRTVTLLNESAEKLLQLRSQDIVGRSVQRLGSAFADVALRAMNENRVLSRQEVRDMATGAILGITASPVDKHGVALIFAKVPAREAAQGAACEDVLGSAYWEFLSARVAQEVKNPLVAINTFAQLLPRKYESPEFRSQFSEVVQKEVARINRVVETLYDFARPPRLTRQRTSVNDVVSNVLATFEERFRAANIALTVDFDMSNPVAELDPLYFAQALHNVIQNAYDVMPDGGKLKVDTRTKGDTCEISVSDTGPGIDPEVAPLIFLPFFSTREVGMGLGLSVAHRIMRQHNGDLRLVSSQAGSTFVFTMPLRAGANAAGDGARARETALTGTHHEDRSGR